VNSTDSYTLTFTNLQSVGNVTVYQTGSDRIGLHWNLNPTATSYRVDKLLGNGTYVTVAINVPTPFYVATGLSPSTPYSFKVYSSNGFSTDAGIPVSASTISITGSCTINCGSSGTVISGNGQCFCSCFSICTIGYLNPTDCSCNPCFNYAAKPLPGTPCNDGNNCTINDTCGATGICGGLNICLPPTNITNPCSGHVCPVVACNINACAIVSGKASCMLTPANNGAPCTGGYCTNGQCHSKIHSLATKDHSVSVIVTILSLFLCMILWNQL